MGEDVESVMGGVRMGVNVDIKRTDGEYRHKHHDISTAVGWAGTENKGIVLLVLPSVSLCRSWKKIERALKCSTNK